MTQRVMLEPAFILHRRYYRNTSLIVELFTLRYGRVAALARSARGLQSRYKGRLELFFPFLVSWTGRSDLKFLGDVELNSMPYLMEGEALLCGFYLNELLMRLLPHDDPCDRLFQHYQKALDELVRGKLESSLRCFEKRLLDELGYGLPLQAALPNEFYQYRADRGFLRCEESVGKDVFSGKSLIALREEQWGEEEALKEIKRLMRLILGELLGHKPLKTRELLK